MPTHIALVQRALEDLANAAESLSTSPSANEPENLQSRLSLFLAALDYLIDGFLAVDAEGMVMASNAKARQLFGNVTLEPGVPVKQLRLPESLKQALIRVAHQNDV